MNFIQGRIFLCACSALAVMAGAGAAFGQQPAAKAGPCEIGSIPRCSIEYYNDGSRSEFYKDAEGSGRVEWRFTGQDPRLTNIFFYPEPGITMELELNPDTVQPKASLTYTSGGTLLEWRTYNEETKNWDDIPLSSGTHKLERFVDSGRRMLRRESCSRRDMKRCTLTRNADGSSTERLLFPNGKIWEESTFKTSNRLDFEFVSFDFWGRETTRKIYDRVSGNLKTAYWFSEKDNQILRYIYDLKTGKETSNVIYDGNRRVLRWEQNGKDGTIVFSVSFNPDGSPKRVRRFSSSRLTEETMFHPSGLPASRVMYNSMREVVSREKYGTDGKLRHFECISGACKKGGYRVVAPEAQKSVCEVAPAEPQCKQA